MKIFITGWYAMVFGMNLSEIPIYIFIYIYIYIYIRKVKVK